MHASDSYPFVFLHVTRRVPELPDDSVLARRIAESILLVLDELGMGRNARLCELSVTITGDEEIRLMNVEHRGTDAATDTLSFPVVEAGELENERPEDSPPVSLGDIVLSVEMIHRQANDRGFSFVERFCECLVHGILHLLGYDHESEVERERMESLEDRIVPAVIRIFG